MSHAVIIKDAVKKYGDFTALGGVSLKIEPGEFFTLLGPSGCGKTTLLRMIAGFNSIDGGEILFDDKVINNLDAHKRDIGMVFQNYAIFPHLTVAENVAYGLCGIIDAILNGDINNVSTKKIPYFDFEVPTELNGVDTGILDPRDTYADASEWETKAKDLAARFIKNFSKYEGNAAGKALVSAGPQL